MNRFMQTSWCPQLDACGHKICCSPPPSLLGKCSRARSDRMMEANSIVSQPTAAAAATMQKGRSFRRPRRGGRRLIKRRRRFESNGRSIMDDIKFNRSFGCTKSSAQPMMPLSFANGRHELRLTSESFEPTSERRRNYPSFSQREPAAAAPAAVAALEAATGRATNKKRSLILRRRSCWLEADWIHTRRRRRRRRCRTDKGNLMENKLFLFVVIVSRARSFVRSLALLH